MLEKGDLPQPNCALPINQMILYGKGRSRISVMAMTLMIFLSPGSEVYYQIKGWLHFSSSKTKTKIFVITSTDGGPKCEKGDQKGTNFGQKSPKGTFPLLGDLLVYTEDPIQIPAITPLPSQL